MNGQPTPTAAAAAPAVASRGRIIMMAVIAGAVITNIYCTQPILPLIASDMNVDVATVDLVAGSALLGFAAGLALLLPLGDRFDRRKLVLGQIVGAFVSLRRHRWRPASGRWWRPRSRWASSAACPSSWCRSRP